MIEPKDIVLVPNSGIQFVTLPFAFDKISRFDRPFIEKRMEVRSDGKPVFRLFPGWNEVDPQADAPYFSEEGDEEYSVNKNKALEPFLNQWVPLPFLRALPGRDANGLENYDTGPTNWSRVRVIKAPHSDDADAPSHMAVFAFDTAVEQHGSGSGDPQSRPWPYTAPIANDILNPQEFSLVSMISRNGWFLGDPRKHPISGEEMDFQSWALSWIENLFVAHRETELGRKLRESDRRFALEHAARWFAFIELLGIGCTIPKVRFMDTISGQSHVRPVDVDLVLDIGNSRTCGLLIENYPNEDNVDLNNSMILSLRDLERPELQYSEPFDSNIEFSQATFGDDTLSRLSGRQRAFLWPGVVRVGPEASRLRAIKGGTAAVGGISSPKRYLWDVQEVNQSWRFPASQYLADGAAPPISRIVRRFLNRNGDVISQIRKDRALYKRLYGKRSDSELMQPSPALSYSRSSLYSLMIAEILFQAIAMINNPQVRAERKQSNAPRRLRRVIMTLPSALPTLEQRLMRSRVEGAVNLLWELMDWHQSSSPSLARPTVQVSWDEATCVQFVWLYSEISRRFGGRIVEYFDLFGKPRQRFEAGQEPKPDTPLEPSLRIASIDIGGGTSDLMITTYYQNDDRALVPVQTFREGIGIAGDDITKSVIERLILPAISRQLSACGAGNPRAILNELFGGDRSNMAEQVKDQRRETVIKVLMPAALGLMSAYEESGQDRYEIIHTKRLDELVPALLKDNYLDLTYVHEAARAGGAVDFNIGDTPIDLDFQRLRSAINETLQIALDCLSEAISHFDCDKVLLSGRPSRLPAIHEYLENSLAVTPDKIQPLHRYRVDIWYPFRSRSDVTIGDPKTTAVVGAMLCALAEGSIVNFSLQTHKLQMRSTAAYIGELGSDGVLEQSRVLFTAEELQQNGAVEAEHKLKIYTRARLGFRQLPLQRWITNPLYQLSIDEGAGNVPRPIEITIAREVQEDESGDSASVLEQEASKEELTIREAWDANGADVRRSINLTFCTLQLDDKSSEYWLDSGTLTVL
ncbi:virulence factor SrfB [Bartonella sp. HY329]|uniref:virulence factor SrfB n=1 Tax=unclassified Bartonella TaxID=2645622 RepID=UPI0021C8EDD3|nr:MULTISPECIES: virulence factor SrfB [unclassified Bartonella]UXM94839.1 virulence factor SrfB [Bartonella sp. HY329]UXN09162.1 virulence factor SrfB [Bartonella sp. HY328]